ncbi:MAG: ABC transporter ATP-binding protein [Kiritimatiellae bacterium]|nr:ABC transporter ATP-binding protein [Kiritimatiellia bacterium]
MSAPPILLDGLSVRYGSGSREQLALDRVSLRVESGSVFGFIGPNGAGKTTTIHVLLGFQPPSEGTARLFGQDVRDSVARRRIGYLTEQPDVYRFLTGRELLRYFGRLCGMRGQALEARIAALLEEVGLAAAADRRLSAYSRGMRQRIGLAQAMVHDPELLILDEPTGGLDPLARRQVRGLIELWRRAGKTVFFSSHELSEVELVCDTVGILSRGRIVALGRPSDLAPAQTSLEQYFMQVIEDDRKGAQPA